MVEKRKVALAACGGMSPYGLVTRIACSDTVESSKDVISICMGATSAEKEGFNKLINKYPIIAVNGCESGCVENILKQKGIKPEIALNIMEILDKEKLKPKNISRIDEQDERSVDVVKKIISEIVEKLVKAQNQAI